ncbi:MAG: hypothetical protein PHT59_07400, partial [Candidatus Omnitrophica bacterium]|nr:hypothetical protein [Candidatus Omnitrophota bacterium]
MKVNWKLVAALSSLIVICAAFYGGYLLFQGADVSMPPLFQRVSSGPRLLMSMEGFRFTQSEDGRVSWRMYAKNADL